jgi:hypothetical protein
MRNARTAATTTTISLACEAKEPTALLLFIILLSTNEETLPVTCFLPLPFF